MMKSTLFKANNKGFSLLETIIAIALGMVVATMVMLVTTNGLKNLRYIKRTERLHANAVFLTDTLTYWIKQARALDASGSTLDITLPDGTHKIIARDLVAKTVTLDGNVVTTSDIEVAALNFVEMARSVRVQMDLQAKNTAQNLSITTTIAHRNTP